MCNACPKISSCILALCVAGVGRPAVSSDPARNESENPSARKGMYQVDIEPLFRAKCVRCHGGEAREADLDLSTLAGALKGSESGPVIRPGNPGESLLYEKVRAGEMPPDEGQRLNEAELKAIQEWIAGGATAGDADHDVTDAPTPLNQHDIIPIMLRRCSACHGLRRREADLDLRTRAAILRGGKSGPAMVPGNPDESLMIQKIRAGQMPPRDRLVEVSIKPIEDTETRVLARWIASGAPEVAVEPDVATTVPDPLVSDRDRDFWAFRAPRPVAVPRVRDPARAANAVDAFLLERLEPKELGFAPDADRATLIRRVTIDLTGVVPAPAEVEAFLGDPAPDAYSKLIDRLLASPRYGERWGRFWLDLAGYADSEGKREQDLPRPHAWRYRDYVIQSMNADKPYDRFLMEQLAGDELADFEQAPVITTDIYDNLVATGFLRMAPDATWANITGYVPDRIEVIADEIDVLGSAIMGLTIKCARCHSHKFDPIPQRDYYRLLDVFKGAYDEYDWLKPDVRMGLGPVSQDVLGGRHLPYVTTAERDAWQAHEAELDREMNMLRASIDGADGKQSDETKRRLQALEQQRIEEPRVQALWDRGEPSPTYVYRRGDPLSTGQWVGPGVPSVLTDGRTTFEVQPPWPGAKQTGRRLAFARWLTRPDHPLTARVQANRIWKHHFGTGIVKTLGNFGLAGAPPTHPELLDWLARNFVRQGWSLKAMHRLLINSTAYQQSSLVTSAQSRFDPDNRLYSRMPLSRLDAEALYDSLLLVADRLAETHGGPPDAVQVRPDGLVTPVESARGWRRLIYVRQSRKQLATHLENFDFPQMNPNCIERRDSVGVPQALHLMNSGMVHELARSFALRVRGDVGDDAVKQIERVYTIALSRPPTGEETGIAVGAMNQLTAGWTRHLTGAGRPAADTARFEALTAFCHAIINSASFLYVD